MSSLLQAYYVVRIGDLNLKSRTVIGLCYRFQHLGNPCCTSLSFARTRSRACGFLKFINCFQSSFDVFQKNALSNPLALTYRFQAIDDQLLFHGHPSFSIENIAAWFEVNTGGSFLKIADIAG